MKLAQQLERMMGMSDAVWLRHANPWSGWTRVPILPLLALAIWSRVWIGAWALGAVALVVLWIWINPRVFAVPGRFDNWMTRGVLGERVFLDHFTELPGHHQRMSTLLGYASLPGLGVMVWGLWALNAQAAVFGTILCMLPKLWFIDRMVWILQDWTAAGNAVPGLPEGMGDV